MSALRPITDGLVLIRPPRRGDADLLIAGRDEVFHRWMGPGAADPRPTGCITVDDEVVGWVDYDVDRDWLRPGEVNVGYNVFAPHRGKGYATRAVQLLMHHLALRTDHHTATLLINPGNEPSLALAARARFVPSGDIGGERYFKRPVPPLTYTDGVVTIRRSRSDDLEADSEATDEAFGTGPKWTFAVDTTSTPYVAYVDCDLGNAHVPRGEANVSYSAHPAHRGKRYVSRAVRLLLRFLRDHTGARAAHIIVDIENIASLRIPRALDAALTEQWVNDHGHTLVRHVVSVAG